MTHSGAAKEADTMNKLVMVLMGLVAAATVLVPVITEAAALIS
jgi:hypothetical protein